MASAVQIANPLSGQSYTNLNRARRYVKKGAAEWIVPGVSIRMLACRSRVAAIDSIARLEAQAAEAARLEREAVRSTSKADYDGVADSGLATFKQMRGLPIAGPNLVGVITLRTTRTPRSTYRLRLKSRVVMANGSRVEAHA